jgi:hypothetical protein
MNFLTDFAQQFAGTVAIYHASMPGKFAGTVAIGIVVAIAFWIACHYYTRLWNLRFRITKAHTLLCAVAAALSFGFCLLYPSAAYMRQTTETRLETWENGKATDSAWQAGVFAKQYDAVKRLSLEDFAKYPPPSQGGNRVPLTKQESQVAFAKVIVDQSVADFNDTHAFLRTVLATDSSVPVTMVEDDIRSYFATKGGLYPDSRGIALAAARIRQGLDIQTPKVVTATQTIIIALFAAIQLAVIAIIGVAAYRDLKVTT